MGHPIEFSRVKLSKSARKQIQKAQNGVNCDLHDCYRAHNGTLILHYRPSVGGKQIKVEISSESWSA